MNQLINRLENFNNTLNLDASTSREILEEGRRLCIILHIHKDQYGPRIFYKYNNLLFVDHLAIYYNRLYESLTLLKNELVLIIGVVSRIIHKFKSRLEEIQLLNQFDHKDIDYLIFEQSRCIAMFSNLKESNNDKLHHYLEFYNVNRVLHL